MKQVGPSLDSMVSECRFNLVFTGDVLSGMPKALARVRNQGYQSGGFAVALLEEQLLPLAHHP